MGIKENDKTNSHCCLVDLAYLAPFQFEKGNDSLCVRLFVVAVVVVVAVVLLLLLLLLLLCVFWGVGGWCELDEALYDSIVKK